LECVKLLSDGTLQDLGCVMQMSSVSI
jgi:hypothetical protein